MTNLIQTTKITKKLILQELMKMKVDHSINISEKELEAKINLLFEDIKEMTAERFLANCEVLRKSELYGKLPANHQFLSPMKSEFNPSKWSKYAN